jgi:hypothetical protein
MQAVPPARARLTPVQEHQGYTPEQAGSRGKRRRNLKSEDSFDSDLDVGSPSNTGRSNNAPRNSNDTGSFQARLGSKKFGEDSVQPRGSDSNSRLSHSVQLRFGGNVPQENKEKKKKKKSKKSRKEY